MSAVFVLALLFTALVAVWDGAVQTSHLRRLSAINVRSRVRPGEGRHRLRRPWPRWLQWLPRRR